MPRFPKSRAARVKAIVFDVDGVLTGGEIVYGPGGEWKIFHVLDGHGFTIARRAGLRVALLSGREAAVVETRAKDLGVPVVQGASRKGEALAKLLAAWRVLPEEACYVGDDLVDLPALRRVGLPIAVANAVPEVKRAAAWVTTRRGGEGAAREVIERVLKAKGEWGKWVAKAWDDEA